MNYEEIKDQFEDAILSTEPEKMRYGELREMLNKHPEWDDLEIRVAENSTVNTGRLTYIPRGLVWVHNIWVFSEDAGIVLVVKKEWEAVQSQQILKMKRLIRRILNDRS